VKQRRRIPQEMVGGIPAETEQQRGAKVMLAETDAGGMVMGCRVRYASWLPTLKAHDRYLKFVRWEEADSAYVGYCPDLFPWGGVCHGTTEPEAYRTLCTLVEEEVLELQHAGKELPAPSTRPMREAVPA
jgi:hypothetical protein